MINSMESRVLAGIERSSAEDAGALKTHISKQSLEYGVMCCEVADGCRPRSNFFIYYVIFRSNQNQIAPDAERLVEDCQLCDDSRWEPRSRFQPELHAQLLQRSRIRFVANIPAVTAIALSISHKSAYRPPRPPRPGLCDIT